MRVAFLVVALEPGGAPTYIIRLAEELIKRGVEVKIISLMEVDTTRIIGDIPITCECLGMRTPYDLSVFSSILSALRNFRPDIVHTNHPIDAMLGNLAARILKIPCVTTFHGTLDHYYLPKTNPISRSLAYLRHLWAERIAGWCADKVIAISNCVREDLVKQGICSLSKITVIHHGVDLSLFDPNCFPPASLNGLIVGCISRIAPEKGVHYFIEAAIKLSERLSGVNFHFIGEAKSWVEQEYFEKYLNILEYSGKKPLFKFLGYRTDIPFLLSQMDVVIIPSLSEGFGLVAAEAMAMGKPVVASNIGGMAEVVIDGETGLLVQPGNVEAIATAVERLLQDACLRQEMGTKARSRAEQAFSQQRMIDQTLRCYSSIVKSQ